MEKERKIKARLTGIYLVALSVLALLVAAGQWAGHKAIRLRAADSEVINISGKQRMYSQRIVKHALLLLNTTDPARRLSVQAALEADLRATEKVSRLLTGLYGVPADPGRTIRKLQAQLKPPFRRMLRAGAEIHRLAGRPANSRQQAAMRAATEVLLAAEPDVLRLSDALTESYTQEANAGLAALDRRTTLFNGLLLLVLGLQAAFVFRPATRMVTKALRQYDRQVERLKDIQASLERSESLYRLVTDNSHDLVRLHDLDGTYRYVSPSVEPMLGYLPEEVVGLNSHDLVHPDDVPRVVLSVQDYMLQGAKPVPYEYRLRHKDGHYIWVELLVKIVADDKGQPLHLLSTARNITARKQAHVRIRELGDKLTGVLNSSLSGIMAFRPVRRENGDIHDFEWTLVNRQAECMVGRTADELMGKHLLEEMPGNGREGLFDKYVQVVDTGIPLDMEHFYDHEGLRTWFHTVAVKLGDGFVVTFSNITKEKESQQQLAQTLNHLHQLVQNMREAVVLEDAAGHILVANAAFCRWFLPETSPEGLAGTHSSEVFSRWMPLVADPASFIRETEALLECRLPVGQQAFWLTDGRILERDFIPIEQHGGAEGCLWVYRDVTERHTANRNIRNLHKTLEAHKAALDMAALVSITDPDGVITYVNEKFIRTSGYSAAELIGATHRIGNSGHHDKRFFQRMWNTIGKGRVWRDEVCNRAKDGSLYWVDSTIVPFLDEAGRPYQYLAIRFDITERRRVEEKLRDSTQLLNALFNHSPVAIQVFDRHGLSLSMNEAQRRFIGVPSVDYGVGVFNVLTDPVSVQMGFDKPYRQALTGEIVELRDRQMDMGVFEHEWQTAARATCFDQIVFPLMNEQGEATAIVSFVLDTTERMRARRELEETSQFMRSILHTLPNYIYILDVARQQPVYANSELLSMLGYELPDFLATDFRFKVHPEDSDRIVEYLRQVAAASGSKVFSATCRMKNCRGEYRVLERRDVVFKRNEEGAATQILGSALDVTEMRQAQVKLQEAYSGLQASEEELRHRGEEMLVINENLEEVIRESKAAQAQLVQSEKMASIGQLTAGIAHEINNPINYIHAGADNLGESLHELFQVLDAYDQLHECPEPGLAPRLEQIRHLRESLYYEQNRQVIRETLPAIKTGAVRTAEIVRGLRNFARLDEAVRKRADVHEGIENTLVLLSHQFKDRITVERHYDPAVPCIDCYPGQLNQVFMNLLTNAIQAISGAGLITIETSQTAAHVVIVIRDSGIGIPEHLQSRIFEPFFTTKDVGQGTGLGLSISYGIIQKHRGEITVWSEPGQGAAFTLLLPRHAPAE